ncbi:MAG TPA: hypothetical protein DEH78_19810 [Solibacterales bacterium]|nr:hypothetical protein [Bryobacterales bacterium]
MGFAGLLLFLALTPDQAATREFTLSNGMRWIVAPAASAPPGETALLLYIDAGIAQETPGSTGVVSTLAALWRRGAADLEKAGARRPQVLANADRIVFRSAWPNAARETWFRQSARLLAAPPLDGFLEARAAVIAEAAKQRLGGGSMLDQFLAIAFLSHPYRIAQFGLPGELERLTLEDAAAFTRRYFVASNAIGVASGDVDIDSIRTLAERHFGSLPAVGKPAPLRESEPAQEAERRMVVHGGARPACCGPFISPPSGPRMRPCMTSCDR